MQITDPDKFEMATILTKNSKTGITSNKRLLVIKKGYLYYYSKVPKTFKGDPKVLESYHQLPKCSIQILNIKKINGYENNSSYFSIEFEAKHMMEREDIRKTMTLEEFNFAPKNTKQIITWQFTCDNQFVKQRWVAALTQLRVHYGKEKINIQKFFQNINSKKQQKQPSLPVRSSTRVPWRQQKMKNSPSNQNLNRTSYINTMLQQNRLSSQNKNLRSDSVSHKQEPQISLKKKATTTEDNIVETFIQEEKEKIIEKPSFKEGISTPQKNDARSESKGDDVFGEASDKQSKKQEKQEKQVENVFKKTESDADSDYNSPRESQETYKLSQIKAVTPHIQQNTNLKSKQEYSQSSQSSQSQQIIPPTTHNLHLNIFQVHNNNSSNIINSHNDYLQRNRQKQLSISPLKPHPSRNKIQFVLNDQQTYYDLFYFGVCREYSFSKRIEAQKMFNGMIGNFVQRAEEEFMQFINTKNSMQSMRYKEIKISDRMSELQIGYLRFHIGYTTTQGIMINDKKKIYYDEQPIKNLKKCMKAYNKILSHIISAFKSNSSLQTDKIVQLSQKLRVPQCTYIEYRGVSCLVYDDHHLDKNQKQISHSAEIEALSELMDKLGLNRSCFEFKKCQKSKHESIIPYIVNTKKLFVQQKKIGKHHNVTFRSPMNTDFLKNAKKQGASTSLQSLSKYLKTIQKLKNPQIFTCPKSQILTILEYIYLCKYIRKFYRAGHAELDEKNFINLIFKDDPNIARMFEIAGFQFQLMGKDRKFLGVFFDFLEYYTGICCTYCVEDAQFINLAPINIKSDRKIDVVSEIKIRPRVISYELQELQLYQSFSKIQKYLLNQEIQMAIQAIQLKQSVYFQNPYQNKLYPWTPNLSCIFNSAQLNFIQNDYISSINQCKQFLQSFCESYSDEQIEPLHHPLPHVPHITIPIYMLLLKCYSKFSPQKFTVTLKKTTLFLIYMYGESSSILVTLFVFVAAAFTSMDQLQKASTLFDKALEIGKSIHNKENLFELYLEGSRLYMSGNRLEDANRILGEAKKIFIQIGANTRSMDMEIKVLSLQLQLLLASAKSNTNEENVIAIINKIQQKINIEQQIQSHKLQELYKLYFHHGCKYNRQDLIKKSLDRLWGLCLDSHAQILAIQLAYKYILKKNYDRFEGVHSEANTIRYKHSYGKQKALMYVSERLMESQLNLIEFVEECMLEENFQILGAIYSLIINSTLFKNITNQT